MNKICTKCKLEKPTSDFYENKKVKSGLLPFCKSCHNKYTKEWAKNNRKKNYSYQRNWVKNNRERFEKMKKEWGIKNPERLKRYHLSWVSKNKERFRKIVNDRAKIRRKIEPKYRLDRSMSSTICKSLRDKHGKSGKRWEEVVGYSIEELITHLESKFEAWMNWDNYGKWHIDHIIPKSHFKYTSKDSPEFKKCWALDNLQPLEAIANIKKGNRVLLIDFNNKKV